MNVYTHYHTLNTFLTTLTLNAMSAETLSFFKFTLLTVRVSMTWDIFGAEIERSDWLLPLN